MLPEGSPGIWMNGRLQLQISRGKDGPDQGVTQPGNYKQMVGVEAVDAFMSGQRPG